MYASLVRKCLRHAIYCIDLVEVCVDTMLFIVNQGRAIRRPGHSAENLTGLLPIKTVFYACFKVHYPKIAGTQLEAFVRWGTICKLRRIR